MSAALIQRSLTRSSPISKAPSPLRSAGALHKHRLKSLCYNAMKNSKPQDFETSLEELERIVRELERGDLPLEKSLELFEQGVKLSRACQERLNEAERRIEILTRDSQGRATVSAFESEDESDDDDQT
jgi:exodeoxyribonuclease VII small subunit